MSDWQTIATAPRDGEAILVTYRHKGIWVYRVAYADAVANETRWLTRPGDWHITPTHWMPLPDPPAHTTGEQKKP